MAKDIYQGNMAAFYWLQIKVAKLIIVLHRALKDQGYESDSTLLFRKNQNIQLGQANPTQQKQAYLSLQSGGEVPVHGFRKPAPEKPKGMLYKILQKPSVRKAY